MPLTLFWQTGSSVADMAAQLEVWKAFTKVHLKDVWAKSLIESHAKSEARNAMLVTFWKEVEKLQGKLKELGLEDVNVTDTDWSSVKWF